MTLSLFDRPGLFADLFQEDVDGLRYYQRERFLQAYSKWSSGLRSLLAVMATGTGKSRFAAAIAKAWPTYAHSFGLPDTVLWLAHRDELVVQGREELERMTGMPVEVEQGDWRAGHKAKLVIGSTQTFHKRRLEKFPADRFGLLIPDEGHHYVAATYKRILDHFACAKILLLTATPDRGDQRALGTITDDVLAPFDIADAITAGYLVPVRGKHVTLEKVDLDKIGKSAGDLKAGELDEAMLASVDGIVQKTLEEEPDRAALCFFPGVRTAELAAARFNFYRPGSAGFVSAETDPLERRRTVRDYKEGRLQYLCNCMVFTEGFDAPHTSLIVQGRPTLSRALYAQMIGRGTRTLPGLTDDVQGEHEAATRRATVAASKKPDMVVLDFVGNSTRHSLVGPEDILGGSYEEAEVKLAKKKRQEGDSRDATSILEDARKELQRLANAKRTKVAAAVREFDPFAVLGVAMEDEVRFASRSVRPATELQLGALKNLGVHESELAGMSHVAASKFLDHIAIRRKRGLCTYKQLAHLRKFGVADTRVTFERANAAITYIASKGWGKQAVDPHVLNSILNHRRQPGED